MGAMKVQGMPRSTLPYIAPFQPYSTYIALVVTVIVVFFKGFDSFIKPSPTSTADAFNYHTFITNYIGIVRPPSFSVTRSFSPTSVFTLFHEH